MFKAKDTAAGTGKGKLLGKLAKGKGEGGRGEVGGRWWWWWW